MTYSFADAGAGLYGLARLGLSGAGGERTGTALAVMFSGQAMAASAHGDAPAAADAGFERLVLPELEAAVDEPLRRWTVAFGAGAPTGFDLAFEALGPPAELGPDEPAARAGGMVGYEQLCRVTGRVRYDGREVEVRCLGQRGHSWGEPEWDRIDATRTLTVWLEDGTGMAFSAVRPAGAGDHSTEARWAALLAPAGSLGVQDPRLSTTYDETGLQRRAGLELWVGADDAYPRRAAGEAVCRGALDLGRLRLDCAFFGWRMDGRSGTGRYDVLRRA